MSVTIKTAREIEKMREAGRLLEQVHDELENFIRPGVSTLEIDQLGEKIIRQMGCIPNFHNVMPIHLKNLYNCVPTYVIQFV